MIVRSGRVRTWVAVSARVLVGVCLIAAGLRKAILGVSVESGETVVRVIWEHVPGGAALLGILPAVEVAIGLCLLMCVQTRLNLLLSLLLLSSFTGTIAAVSLISPEVRSCGCGLGGASGGTISGSLLVNGALLLGVLASLSAESSASVE